MSKLKIQRSPLGILLAASITLNALLWALALIVFPKGNAATVLHYSVEVGIDFIGAGHQIAVLPIAGLILLSGNTALGFSIRRADQATTWLLWGVMPLIQLVTLGAFILIWQANR